MQRLAEPVERQRLDVELDVGGGVVWRRLREHAELRRRHGQRPATAQRVVEAHQGALAIGLGVDVERARPLDPEDRAQLQMILQVLADAGQGAPQPCADRLHRVRTAEAGDLHEPRRADRAGRQQHFAARPRLERLPFPDIGEAGRATLLEQDGFGVRTVDHPEVGPAEDRLQEGGRRAPAAAAPLVDLEIVRSLVVAAIEVA